MDFLDSKAQSNAAVATAPDGTVQVQRIANPELQQKLLAAFVPEGAVNIAMDDDFAVLRIDAHTPFELDGTQYGSVDAFIQSLRFPEGSRERTTIARFYGPLVKDYARRNRAGYGTHTTYRGEAIEFMSRPHNVLIFKAQWTKYTQNADARETLLLTDDAPLAMKRIGEDGYVFRESRLYPPETQVKTLEYIRGELQKQLAQRTAPTPTEPEA